MINDLAVQSALRSSHGKYVDDLKISEVVTVSGTSSFQSDLDIISQYVVLEECKEMKKLYS